MASALGPLAPFQASRDVGRSSPQMCAAQRIRALAESGTITCRCNDWAKRSDVYRSLRHTVMVMPAGRLPQVRHCEDPAARASVAARTDHRRLYALQRHHEKITPRRARDELRHDSDRRPSQRRARCELSLSAWCQQIFLRARK